jgi:hypothetical protein
MDVEVLRVVCWQTVSRHAIVEVVPTDLFILHIGVRPYRISRRLLGSDTFLLRAGMPMYYYSTCTGQDGDYPAQARPSFPRSNEKRAILDPKRTCIAKQLSRLQLLFRDILAFSDRLTANQLLQLLSPNQTLPPSSLRLHAKISFTSRSIGSERTERPPTCDLTGYDFRES